MVDRDEILRRVDLAALLDQLSPAPPYRIGRSARWRCIDPTHEDNRPSVTMFTDQRGIGRWKCWSGGHGGTAIDALVTARGLTIAQALRQLGDRTGLREYRPPERPAHQMPPTNGIESIVRYVEACERILWTPTGKPVLDYLVNDRGLDPEVLRFNRVGADPGPAVLPRPAGMPRGGVAAVLPTLGIDGDITYAQARYLQPPAGRSKYDNPAGRLAPNPKLGWIATPDNPSGPFLVCEGLIDGLTAATAGYRAVSLLGATYVDREVAQRIVDTVGQGTIVLALDGDVAGQGACRNLANLLDGHPLASLDFVGDLNDHLRRGAFPVIPGITPDVELRIATP